MHAEDDEHLPDAAHQNGGQCGNVVGKEVVGSSNGVCQHIGHRPMTRIVRGTITMVQIKGTASALMMSGRCSSSQCSSQLSTSTRNSGGSTVEV